MANKIQEYRATLPDQLKTTLASLLSSQRTLVPEIDSSGPGPSGEPAPGYASLSSRVSDFPVVSLLAEISFLFYSQFSVFCDSMNCAEFYSNTLGRIYKENYI
ncbi:hypothetical protein LINGRAPRIM_LOCUS1808 [Linum grandiflorum]